DQVRRDFAIAPDAPLVVAVGRADHTKDWPGLLEAMEVVWRDDEGCILILIGPTKEEMSELGVALPSRVKALGWQQNTADFMNAADVVAIPSWTEGNSNVAGEALRLGAPVVCTDTGAHPPIVAEAGGRVVPIRRPDLLGVALLDLLRDPSERAGVRAVASRRLSVEAAVEATVDT